MAYEVVELTGGTDDLVVLGIPSRGVPLARRLAASIAEVSGHPVDVGSLDVTMYRDDLRLRALRPLETTAVPSSGIDGRTVLLVDDVLMGGRTVRAALDALNDVGRPRTVRLAVLIDRGHRDLPLHADVVGRTVPTERGDQVRVRLVESDGVDEVRLIQPTTSPSTTEVAG
jgi:pyrimidine operon attenuation protein/uracil phosphoribosyltransferase